MSRFTPQQHRAAHAEKVDQFADMLAEGLSVPEASRRLGQHQSWGKNVLQAMRRRLGPQAC